MQYSDEMIPYLQASIQWAIRKCTTFMIININYGIQTQLNRKYRYTPIKPWVYFQGLLHVIEQIQSWQRVNPK